jgi:hypothetical protein
MSLVSKALRRMAYRARQVFLSWRSPLREEELAEARRLLGPLFPLFEGMSRRDRRHCLDVYQRLRAWGVEDRHLLMAALLHDVGKGREVRLWHRVAFVMLQSLAPALLARARGGLASLRDHPRLGADLLRAYGAPQPVIYLVLHHEDVWQEDTALALLQKSDDSC